MPERKSALILKAVTPETRANAQPAAEDVDPFAAAMDSALGLENRQLRAISRWNVHAIEFAWTLAPVICDLFCLAVKACVEVQLNWIAWALPERCLSSVARRLGASAELPAAGESREQWMDGLARSMDTAIEGFQQETPERQAARNALPPSAATDRGEDHALPSQPLAVLPRKPVQSVPREAKAAATSNLP